MTPAQRRTDQPSENPAAGYAFFGLLVLGAFIIQHIWWFLAAAGLVALVFVGWAVVRKEREARQAAEQREADIIARAEQQNRWTMLGDSRGVYGTDGAKLMHSIAPGLPPAVPAGATGKTTRFAAIAHTPAELSKLVAEKLPCWRWALFASVLVQRRAKVLPRLRDQQLRYPPPKTVHARSGSEVRRLVAECMNKTVTTIQRLEAFMQTGAFMGMFGDPADEDTADAGGIKQTANRLMDFHDRLLKLAEDFRGVTAADTYAALLADVNQMMDAPLEGYQHFIDEFVERVEAMPQLVLPAGGKRGYVIDAGSIRLHMEIDHQIAKRVHRQLKKLRFFEWASAAL